MFDQVVTLCGETKHLFTLAGLAQLKHIFRFKAMYQVLSSRMKIFKSQILPFPNNIAHNNVDDGTCNNLPTINNADHN